MDRAYRGKGTGTTGDRRRQDRRVLRRRDGNGVGGSEEQVLTTGRSGHQQENDLAAHGAVRSLGEGQWVGRCESDSTWMTGKVNGSGSSDAVDSGTAWAGKAQTFEIFQPSPWV